MLKAIQAHETTEVAKEKAENVIVKLADMRVRAAARLRHVAGTQWGARRYLNIDRLQNQNPRKETLEVVGAG